MTMCYQSLINLCLYIYSARVQHYTTNTHFLLFSYLFLLLYNYYVVCFIVIITSCYSSY